ncbi:NmrA family NAD(P)-binding protein [Cupriavidus sp. 2TAF22]|uniref:NmrA family NAD(P)-binding protein n=1 Tax=unclassified Cupriavidus TaxID=2640874 RepID=UPI003F91FAC8
MFAVTGITGKVGGVVARALLSAGRDVRAVVRSAHKGAEWAAQGCEVALAEMSDAQALQRAFTGTEAVFVLLPPNFDPCADLSESRAIVTALRQALLAARPRRVVCLSTIGAQATQPNLLQQLSHMERELGTLPVPVAFVRAGWFMENTLWDIEPALAHGVLASYLQPLDKPVPMVATADVGRVAAELLQQSWEGRRVVELEGPRRIAPLEIAAALSTLLGREVKAQVVPRASWEALFRAQGMNNPVPRAQMLDGFNAGWIDFEAAQADTRKGTVPLQTVLAAMVERQQ